MPAVLTDHLRHCLAGDDAAAPLCVAFSGGPDSTALLHALAQQPQARGRGLRALHVDHGLHADSAAWADHCRRFCAALGIPCDVRPATVDLGAGQGLEAAAREARYRVFAETLREGERLLLAHHRDDQVETVLLKLLRGAGPEGLGGMRERRAFARGELWRPLLGLPRQALLDYLAAHRLPSLDDPSNADTGLARNHLRHEILPRLARHWPQAADSIAHSATLCRAAADALRASWQDALATLRDPRDGSLDAAGWLALAPALREPLLDHWLHDQGLPAPTTAQRRQIERQCGARPGQRPCIRWPSAELQIWKGRLWALPPAPTVAPDWHHDGWRGAPLPLPDGGLLELAGGATLGTPLDVRLRRGGEHIRPLGHAHTRELRDLFQQAVLPPWQRLACPLLYAGDELVAVADRWLSERGAALLAPSGGTLHWRPGRGTRRA
ncbi:tRNA lysidine(34) synthetase TilS [Frateuria defendens]|uniref:tRNA lysidine(34) synthetase TilS n=1 Tax=Frateuria defendens TaxID=2219559 RepID=UPI00066FEB9C|nr:tRNA lysidine(34) synthetase TilS [Frateuria defendens]